ncbi:hypothetical protein DSO57_1025336 [Entomophthora muscae]|uniref:Uncharacterized protein n=1 Tax=Entomophthora muscae TaxID=34485 RepID=A0ACC2SFB4_9FUNG|nr:hypothetical protein DSO57_1025336 [Entomophthora muscae]
MKKGISQKDALLVTTSARAQITITTAVPTTSVLMCSAPLQSCAPSPDQDYTPPPLKCHEREANPLPEELPIDIVDPTTPESQATAELIDEVYKEGTHAPPTTPSLSTPPPTVCGTRWNPKHPKPFAPLKEQLDFNDPLLAKEDLRYHLVTVETVPESPAAQTHTNNSIELNLEIPSEFPTGSNSPDTFSLPVNVTNKETHTDDSYILDCDSI